ncbi:superoxide dismutase [Paraliobacillus quinghaiensis]|uniref:Superoxide dismutase [Cu-Zn] n=1 Tax=Paraliobacillus quinghaiensis TaxID=470815 RepID=A0A917TT97_9BACI|nr:superoxide dismutase family protein [Paraliobacillus quinghaiensis]GGM37101.1 superoxide dismutase [Paraliobacillus quinghaiensis]
MKKTFLIPIVLLILTACQQEDYSPMTVTMYNQANDAIGTAKLSESADGVSVELSAEGLEPGLHGIHVHEYAKCDPPDFQSAGNHYNPDGKEHGLMHPEGSHLGDMPNIEVDGDGTVEAELLVPGATLTEGNYSLLQGEGTSIVIHEKQDDGVSQPSGDAGKRIACGLITVEEANEETAPSDPTANNKEEE